MMIIGHTDRYSQLCHTLRDIRWRLDAVKRAEKLDAATRAAAITITTKVGRVDINSIPRIAARAAAAAGDVDDDVSNGSGGDASCSLPAVGLPRKGKGCSLDFLKTPGPAYGLVRVLRMIEGDFRVIDDTVELVFPVGNHAALLDAIPFCGHHQGSHHLRYSAPPAASHRCGG